MRYELVMLRRDGRRLSGWDGAKQVVHPWHRTVQEEKPRDLGGGQSHDGSCEALLRGNLALDRASHVLVAADRRPDHGNPVISRSHVRPPPEYTQVCPRLRIIHDLCVRAVQRAENGNRQSRIAARRVNRHIDRLAQFFDAVRAHFEKQTNKLMVRFWYGSIRSRLKMNTELSNSKPMLYHYIGLSEK